MKTKKVLTPNLKPGMVSSEAAYTFTNHLVIQSNTTLTPEIIDKLKYYAIKSIKVYVTEEEEGLAEQRVPVQEEKTDADFGLNLEGPTYFERIQQTEHFMEFC